MNDHKKRAFIMDNAKVTNPIFGAATLGKKLILPQTTEAANVEVPDSNCVSNKKGGRKILVAYASEFGTTGEVAKAIGEVLCQEGNTVETKWVKHVTDMQHYNAFIVGSAIQYDRWMPEATEFIIANQTILSKRPVAFFFTCLVLSKQSEKAAHKAKTYSDKLYSLVPHVKPVSVGRFAGVLDYSKMSFFFRLIARGIFVIVRVQEGDYRDWDAIRSWAKGIHLKLSSKPAYPSGNL
jgi:menaquinone-dependent protoporphyrinogen oxidase